MMDLFTITLFILTVIAWVMIAVSLAGCAYIIWLIYKLIKQEYPF